MKSKRQSVILEIIEEENIETQNQLMDALARRTDFFSPADEPPAGNLTWCVKSDGWHTYDDCWEYLWLAAPHLFG